MTVLDLEKLYVEHRAEALSLAVRKWGYTHDHAEDAVQRAALYLLECWKKATPPGRTAFLQNVRQQCSNLMGLNTGRSMSRGTAARMIPIGGQHELELAELDEYCRVRGGQPATSPKMFKSNLPGINS